MPWRKGSAVEALGRLAGRRTRTMEASKPTGQDDAKLLCERPWDPTLLL